MSGTSTARPTIPGSPAWTLFPPTPSKCPPSEKNMQNTPSIIIEEPLLSLESMEESSVPPDIATSPLGRHPVDRDIYQSTRSNDLERPDTSATRKQVFDRPSTAMGTSPQETLATRPGRHSVGIKTVPPRSSSRTENHVSDSRHNENHHPTLVAMGHKTPSTVGTMSVAHSRASSTASYHTNATSLPALQSRGFDENEQLEPLCEEELDPGSFDLVAPHNGDVKHYSLETRSELLFSEEHLKIIFQDPSLFLRFTGFLSAERPTSVPVLLYYLDSVKALKALEYSNAVSGSLESVRFLDFTNTRATPARNLELEEKSRQAFETLAREDLPAYITWVYIKTVTTSIQRRITGTLPPHLREASEGLAEVFCLTDPSRPDNPIVFASEEFHRTTQYGMSYVIGKNCRFLQGPKTNKHSVRRLRENVEAGKEHCEVFLNYRRDGSPFMNLLMTAPLCDSRGTIRYYIGAQVDVSGLVKECSDMESLKRLVIQSENKDDSSPGESSDNDRLYDAGTKFEELSEMLNMDELETVRRRGGRMRQHNSIQEDVNSQNQNWHKGRLELGGESPDGAFDPGPLGRVSGQLSGIYENYLLVRPYPSLRILFASPSLRIPGILQSPFMNKIGGSGRIREELTRALADGQGVTAKVKWLSRHDNEGRNRWVHCTPLLGSNGAVGVWMVVVADEEDSPVRRKYRIAPPVDPAFGRHPSKVPAGYQDDTVSLGDFTDVHQHRQRDSGKYTSETVISANGDGRTTSRAGKAPEYQSSLHSVGDNGSAEGSVRL